MSGHSTRRERGFLWLVDKIIPHLHPNAPMSEAEGIKTSWRSVLLVMAITLHNIPDGLAGGVGFGGIASNLGGTTLAEVLAPILDVGLG